MTFVTDVTTHASAHLAAHGWIQNRMEDETGRVCLAGAVWACAADPTAAALTLAVLRAQGLGEEWNDAPERTEHEVRQRLATLTITESDLTRLIGPHWREVAAILRRAETLSGKEHQRLSVADSGDLWVARHVAQDRASERGRAAVAHIEIPPVRQAISGGIGDALWAVATSDLIGEGGYTRADSRLLMDAWTRVVGCDALASTATEEHAQ